MQGDGSSNAALKCTYSNMQSNELYQAMQTGTVPSELTERVKENKKIYINHKFSCNVYIIK